MRDPEFGPVRVRAFGTYAIRVSDPGAFIKEIVGTEGQFTTDEVTDQIRNILVARFSDAMAESGIAVLDMAANYDELGTKLGERVEKDMTAYGLELKTLLVENISLPPAVEEALDKRTSMGVLGDMSQYTQYQAATAIGDAAKNPGSAAGWRQGGWARAWASPWRTRSASPSTSRSRVAGSGRTAARAPGPPVLRGRRRQADRAVHDRCAEDADRPGQGHEGDARLDRGHGANGPPPSGVDAVAKLFGAVPPPLPPG